MVCGESRRNKPCSAGACCVCRACVAIPEAAHSIMGNVQSSYIDTHLTLDARYRRNLPAPPAPTTYSTPTTPIPPNPQANTCRSFWAP